MCAEKISSQEGPGGQSAAAILNEFRWRQNILLVGGNESRQCLRPSILRSHGVQVDVARTLADSRFLWQRNNYDWVLLDVHSLLPGAVVEFCEQLKHSAPKLRIAFFVGPPAYVSRKWPAEILSEEQAKVGRQAGFKAAA